MTPDVRRVPQHGNQVIFEVSEKSSEKDAWLRSFKVSLAAGQTLVADLDAEFSDDGTWYSSLDNYLRLFDASGFELTNNGFTGSDSFTYVANDGTADSSVAAVAITVNVPSTVSHENDSVAEW